MSLTGPDYWPATSTVLITAKGRTCFYCYHAVADPAVVWSGATGEIFLHAPCVVELTIRLYRDVHQLETATHRNVTEAPA